MSTATSAVPRLPALFISHGGPTSLWEPKAPIYRVWSELWSAVAARTAELHNIADAASVPRPTAILVLSPHWHTNNEICVSSPTKWKTYHDFGFPFPFMYEKMYEPAGASVELTQRVVDVLSTALSPDVKVRRKDRAEGLDHGVWVPLALIFPEADVPVVQVSLRSDDDAELQLRVGRAVRQLRHEHPTLLVVGSGAMTHNLGLLRGAFSDDFFDVTEPPFPEQRSTTHAQPNAEMQEFVGVVRGALHSLHHTRTLAQAQQCVRTIMTTRTLRRAHPTVEHLVPLFFALGAAMPEDDEEAPSGSTAALICEPLYEGFALDNMAMDVWLFDSSSSSSPPTIDVDD